MEIITNPIIIEKPKINYLNLVLILFAFVLFSTGVYFLGKQSVKTLETVEVVPTLASVAILPQATTVPTSTFKSNTTWKTYENKLYGFSFKYPEDLKLSSDPKFPDNYTIKNSSTFIAFNIQSTCLNTQCLTIQSLDEIANNMLGLDVLSSFKIGKSNGIKITNGFMVEIPNSNNLLLLNSGQYTPIVDQILSTFNFTESKAETMKVKIYQTPVDVSLSCESTDFIEVNIPKSVTPLKDSINYLIAQFKNNNGFKLKSATIANGLATLTFEDPNFFTSGGSCKSMELSSQIEKTALQFPTVKKVKFIGPEYLFQP